MVFKGTPGLAVRVTRPKIGEPKAFRFDKNGLYETNRRSMIRRLSARFATADAKIAQTTTTGDGLFHCKKCDFASDNRGLLLAHIRKEHPKTDKQANGGRAEA